MLLLCPSDTFSSEYESANFKFRDSKAVHLAVDLGLLAVIEGLLLLVPGGILAVEEVDLACSTHMGHFNHTCSMQQPQHTA